MNASSPQPLLHGLCIKGWVLLIGYFDETHTHDGDAITGVAGWLFKRETFPEFERLWNERVQSIGAPFHAAECHAQRGPFSSWPREDCQRLINDLARLIAAYRGPGFVCFVEDGEFADWAKANPEQAQWVQNPYSLCLLSTLDLVRAYLAEEAPDKSVDLYFETGAKGGKQAMEFIHRILTNDDLKEKYRLLGLNFRNKAAYPVLGSADFLAWEWQRNYRESIRDNGGAWREPFQLLFENEASSSIYHRGMDGRRMTLQAMRNAMQGIHRD